MHLEGRAVTEAGESMIRGALDALAFAQGKKDHGCVHGSDNVFRDFGVQNADAEQLRAMLAAQIIRALDERPLTVRQAESLTGIAAADFSRIRRARLDRFTIDRLMTILSRLDRKIEVTVTVRPTQKHHIDARP
jgi:predicted XRE-type DNA-binding protein